MIIAKPSNLHEIGNLFNDPWKNKAKHLKTLVQVFGLSCTPKFLNVWIIVS